MLPAAWSPLRGRPGSGPGCLAEELPDPRAFLLRLLQLGGDARHVLALGEEEEVRELEEDPEDEGDPDGIRDQPAVERSALEADLVEEVDHTDPDAVGADAEARAGVGELGLEAVHELLVLGQRLQI